MSVELEGIYPVRISAATLEKTPDELDNAARGELFVQWPRPPRVGTKIRIELAFGEDAPQSLPALVTWSRPPRTGIMAGFRARLESPPPLVMDMLTRMVDKARDRVLVKQISSGVVRKAPLQREAVIERVRTRPSSDDRGDPPPARGPIAPPANPAPSRRLMGEQPPVEPPRRPGPGGRALELSLPPLEAPGDDDRPPFDPGDPRTSQNAFAQSNAHQRRDAIEFDADDGLSLELETFGSGSAPASRSTPPPAPPPPASPELSLPPLERPFETQPTSDDNPFASLESPSSFAPSVSRPPSVPPPMRPRSAEFIGVEDDDALSLELAAPSKPAIPPRAPPAPAPAKPALRPPPSTALNTSRAAATSDDDAFDLAFDLGGPPAPAPAPVPAPAPPPSRSTTPPPPPLRAAPPPAGLDESIFDDVESPAPPTQPQGVVGRPQAVVPPPPPPPAPIRIGFANLRSFQMHHRLFLANQRVYCTTTPFPEPGASVPLVVDLPDGTPAHVGLGIVEAHVGPPQVPAPGWVAVLLDPDGSLEARIREAARMNGIA